MQPFCTKYYHPNLYIDYEGSKKFLSWTPENDIGRTVYIRANLLNNANEIFQLTKRGCIDGYGNPVNISWENLSKQKDINIAHLLWIYKYYKIKRLKDLKSYRIIIASKKQVLITISDTKPIIYVKVINKQGLFQFMDFNIDNGLNYIGENYPEVLPKLEKYLFERF